MRRNALAPVSQNAVHSRNSMSAAARNPRHAAPSKPHDPRRASALPSVGGGAGARRSTAAYPHNGRASSSAMRASLAHNGGRGGGKDPRPLTSKAYMHDNIKRLHDFLTVHNYEPVTAKQLSNPSSRDFEAIFVFIMRLVDPCFDFAKSFQEEIPVLLKCLHYPFPLSKSALSAVGSPHTWPTLLGVLVWLTGLVTYGVNCDAHEENAATLDKVTRRSHFFHNNTASAYNDYLDGIDEHPEHDAELDNHFQQDDARHAEEVSKLQAEVDGLSQTLKALSTEESPLAIAKAQSKDLRANQDKLRVLLAKLHEHFRVISAKASELDADVATARAALQDLAQDRGPVAAALQRQQHASINAEQLANDREALRDGLAECAKQVSAAERALSVEDARMTAAQDALSATLAEYHRELDFLSQSPRSGDAGGAGAARGGALVDAHAVRRCRVEVSRNASVVDAHELLGREKGEDVASGLHGVADRLRAGVPALQERALRLSEAVDELEERLIMQRDEQTLRQSQLKKRATDYDKGKQALTTALSERSKTILVREEEMLQVRRAQEMKMREVERQNDGLRDQLKVLRDKFAASREHYSAILAEDAKRLRVHQEDMLEAVTVARRQFEHLCARDGVVVADDDEDGVEEEGAEC